MQTKQRWDPPRNRGTYPCPAEVDSRGRFRGGKRAYSWHLQNVAEYWLWIAVKMSNRKFDPDCRADREAAKARARFYLACSKRVGS